MVRYDSLKGKVAICTGGGSGMARAASLKFAENGVKVAVVDIDAPAADETVSLIEKAGETAISIKADMGQAEDIKAMVKQTIDAFGRLNYAFNSVGIGGVPGGQGGAMGISDEAWLKMINIDLNSVWLCMNQEVPEILKVGGGAIVNTSSMAGTRAHRSAAYAAAKHGIIGLTKSAAVILGPQNIRINAICPGYTRTKMWLRGYPSAEEQERLRQMVPLRRIGTPEDIANLVLFLCSDEGSYITGAAVSIDGGLSA